MESAPTAKNIINMKPVMPVFRALLESKGVTVLPVRYVGQGRKLFAIGFDAANDQGTITVEPQGDGNCFLSFDQNKGKGDYNRPYWSCHYYHKKDGFQPAVTKAHSNLKSDMCKFFNI
jgi:hypothetical protein